MARLTYDDVEDCYARVLRHADELGIPTADWVFTHGELAHNGARRSAYRITRDGERLFTLGYTRRSAVDALVAIATAYELALTVGAA